VNPKDQRSAAELIRQNQRSEAKMIRGVVSSQSISYGSVIFLRNMTLKIRTFRGHRRPGG
jgi:hypothetical protein